LKSSDKLNGLGWPDGTFSAFSSVLGATSRHNQPRAQFFMEEMLLASDWRRHLGSLASATLTDFLTVEEAQRLIDVFIPSGEGITEEDLLLLCAWANEIRSNQMILKMALDGNLRLKTKGKEIMFFTAPEWKDRLKTLGELLIHSILTKNGSEFRTESV
jgi:hypothetical protein